jgi:twitching motility protein PilT
MSDRLGEVLVEQGVLDHETLESAKSRQRSSGMPLGRVLLSEGHVNERQLIAALAAQVNLPFVDVTDGTVDPNAAALISREMAEKLCALPVAFRGDSDLLVAVADPSNTVALQQIEARTALRTIPALAVRADLKGAIVEFTDENEPPPAANGQATSTMRLLAHEQAMSVGLDELLMEVINRDGSDLHLTAGSPPVVRVHGELVPLTDYELLTPDELQKMLYSILTQKQREAFENDLELDLSYSVPGQARFRVNVFQQRDALGSVMRIIPFEIKALDELGLPSQIANFAYLPRGFVLVTGPTGSGKSTTLASLIDVINRERSCHIITIEDPIEFLHEHKKSLVNQRELRTDTHSFTAALKHVLRQDPDVILVGEMRDLETIQVALTAAETGHLVFGTLHTQDAPQTIDRVIDVFPPYQQEQIRIMLAGALQGVIAQQLVKVRDGVGRVVVTEVLTATPAVRNLIREGKTHQIYSAIQAGKQHGMISMDQSLANLVLAGKISHSEGLERCSNVADYNRLCGKL